MAPVGRGDVAVRKARAERPLARAREDEDAQPPVGLDAGEELLEAREVGALEHVVPLGPGERDRRPRGREVEANVRAHRGVHLCWRVGERG